MIGQIRWKFYNVCVSNEEVHIVNTINKGSCENSYAFCYKGHWFEKKKLNKHQFFCRFFHVWYATLFDRCQILICLTCHLTKKPKISHPWLKSGISFPVFTHHAPVMLFIKRSKTPKENWQTRAQKKMRENKAYNSLKLKILFQTDKNFVLMFFFHPQFYEINK